MLCARRLGTSPEPHPTKDGLHLTEPHRFESSQQTESATLSLTTALRGKRQLPYILCIGLGAIVLTGCQSTEPRVPPSDAQTLQPGPASHLMFSDAQHPHFGSRVDWDSALGDSASTPVPPTDLWDRLRAGFRLEIDGENPRIVTAANWYSEHAAPWAYISARASRYLYFILEEIESRDLPAELALLPVVESSYDPFAYSHGRASGLWQFIPSTAAHLGLRQNWWYDGRRDLRTSTQAALDYLQQLHRRYDGDWLLALAAYNSGMGTVDRAMRRNRQRGLGTAFWDLDLPSETQAYVPKLLAVAQLVRTPLGYGLNLPAIPNAPYFEVVDCGSQIDLSLAAELAGISVEELYLLNPGYNRWATDPNGGHELLVPLAAAARLQAGLLNHPPETRLEWVRYRVARGDSLRSIALAHRTSVEALRAANAIQGHLIHPGDQLMIPVAKQIPSAYALSQEQRLAQLRARSGQRGQVRLDHRVAGGESFWSVARKYEVDMHQLARWNGLAIKDTLRPGQTLVVWQRATTTATQAGLPQQIRKLGYRVRSGESLATIASKFNVNVRDILEWNNDLRSRKYIHPGDRLTLYVDVAQTSS